MGFVLLDLYFSMQCFVDRSLSFFPVFIFVTGSKLCHGYIVHVMCLPNSSVTCITQ